MLGGKRSTHLVTLGEQLQLTRLRLGGVSLFLDFRLETDVGDRVALGVERSDTKLEAVAERDSAAVQDDLDVGLPLVFLMREPKDHLPPESPVGGNPLGSARPVPGFAGESE